MRIGRGWRNHATMTAMTLLLAASLVKAEENYCLSPAEMAAVVGTRASQSGDRVPGGPAQLRTQNCSYKTTEPPDKSLNMIVDMTVQKAETAAAASSIFKGEASSFGSMMGPSHPVSGLGDEALLYGLAIYVRQKNWLLSFSILDVHMSDEAKGKLLKLLAAKALSRLH